MGLVGVFRMEADLDSEQKTRRGGMNINNILCWKIVTMDIIESRREKWEAGFIPGLSYCVCTCRCPWAAFLHLWMHEHACQEDRAYLSTGIPTLGWVCTRTQVCGLAFYEGVWSFPTVIMPVTVGVCLWSVWYLSEGAWQSPCFIFPVIAAANLLCVGLMSREVRGWGM